MTQLLRRDSISRRQLLRGAGVGLTGASAALLFGCGGDEEGSGGEAEATTVRLPAWDGTAICLAPLLYVEKFMAEEGLQVEWVSIAPDQTGTVHDGSLDFAQDFAAVVTNLVSANQAVTILGGVHSGCTELFARESITDVGQLRRVAVPFGKDAQLPYYAFMLSIMNYIGVPAGEISVSSQDPEDLPSLLQSGEIDGVLAIAPGGEHLRDLEGVRVLIRTADDPPWSSHYCCMFFGNSDFVTRNPETTKRTLRALYQAVDLTVLEPETIARHVVETTEYPFSLEETTHQLMHPHWDIWRTFSVEDTLRFYALRLREAGEIDATPDEILKHVDLTYFNELKTEMAFAPVQSPRRAGRLNCDTSVAGPLAWAPTAGRKPSQGVRS